MHPVNRNEVRPFLEPADKLLYKVRLTNGYAGALAEAHDLLHLQPALHYSWHLKASEGLRIARDRGVVAADIVRHALAYHLLLEDQPHRTCKTLTGEDRSLGKYLLCALSKRINRKHWNPRCCGIIGEHARQGLGLFCIGAVQWQRKQALAKQIRREQLTDLSGAE